MAFTYARAGQVVTASLLNDIGLVGQSVFRATRDTSQSITSNVSPQIANALGWETIELDDLGGWSGGSSTRYTVQREGWYTIAGSVGFNASATGTLRGIAWFLNGVLMQPGHARPHANTPAAITLTAEARIMTPLLGLGDYIELVPYHDGTSGGLPANLNTATGSIRPYIEVAFSRPPD